MQQPDQPTLEEFDLSPADMASLPQPRDHLPWFAIAIGMASVFLPFYFVPLLRSVPYVGGVFFFIAFGLFIPLSILTALFSTLLTNALWNAILDTRFPKYKNYRSYSKALSKYETQKREYAQWVQRTREDYWRSLSGVAFEVELGKLFALMGYKVQQTPATGDGGVDLLIRRNGALTVVQCKAHQKKIAIGVVRELSATINDFKAQAAILACFEGVTKPVVEYIKDKPITILTVSQIVEIQRKYGG